MLIGVALIGKEESLRQHLEGRLSPGDVNISTRQPKEFWRRPQGEPFDLAIVDHEDLPQDFMSAIKGLRKLPERPELVVRYPDNEPGNAAAFQAAGAFAILPGELSDRQLCLALDKLIARRREMMKIRLQAADSVKAPLSADQFVSKSPTTQQTLKMARRVAASDTSLLLLGETGAGKDWLARAIHGESPRVHAPFIAVNCGAVPESLLESELFGHVKGSFTGALKDRRGYFELAHRGTLFLDEVGEMPTHLQVRLLRVLQDRQIQRLGSEDPVEVDVRIIAATNRNLNEAMNEGSFRQDLYYRLAVVTLQVPALRDRIEDIPDLVEIYLDKLTKKVNRSDVTGLTPQALEALLSYDWPGNVRELVNVIERAVLLCDVSEIDVVDLPVEIGMRHGTAIVNEVEPADRPLSDLDSWLDQPLDIGRLAIVADFERRYLAHHLKSFHGNISKTAAHSGIDPRTLYSKMKQLGLRKEDFKRG